MSASIPEFSNVNELNYNLSNLNTFLKTSDTSKIDIEEVVGLIAKASESLKTKDSKLDTIALEKLNGRISEFKSILKEKKIANSENIEKSLNTISEIRDVLVGKHQTSVFKNPIRETTAKLSSLTTEIRNSTNVNEESIKSNLNEITKTARGDNIQPEHLAELGAAINEFNRASEGKFSAELGSLFDKIAPFSSTKDLSQTQNAKEVVPKQKADVKTSPNVTPQTEQQIRDEYLKAMTESSDVSTRANALREILKTFPSTHNKPNLEHLKLEITFALYRDNFTTLITSENPDPKMLEQIKLALEQYRSDSYPPDLSQKLELLISIVENQRQHLPAHSAQTQEPQANTSSAKENKAETQQEPHSAPPIEQVLPQTARQSLPPSPSRPAQFIKQFEEIKNALKNQAYNISAENKTQLINTFLTNISKKELTPLETKEVLKNILNHYRENSGLYSQDSLQIISQLFEKLNKEDKKEIFTDLLKHCRENSRSYSKEVLTTFSRLLENEKDLDIIKIEFDTLNFPKLMEALNQKSETLSHIQEIRDLNNKKNQLIVDQSNLNSFSLEFLRSRGEIKQIEDRIKQLENEQTINREKLKTVEEEKKQLNDSLLANFKKLLSASTPSPSSILLKESDITTDPNSPNSPFKVYKEFFETETTHLEGLVRLNVFLNALKNNKDTNKDELEELQTITNNAIKLSTELLRTLNASFNGLVLITKTNTPNALPNDIGKIKSFDTIDLTKMTKFFKAHRIELINLVVSGARAVELAMPISESIQLDKLNKWRDDTGDNDSERKFQEQIDQRQQILQQFASDPLLGGGAVNNRTISLVQRGPRYKMLLEDLIKKLETEMSHLKDPSKTAGFTELLNELKATHKEIAEALQFANKAATT